MSKKEFVARTQYHHSKRTNVTEAVGNVISGSTLGNQGQSEAHPPGELVYK